MTALDAVSTNQKAELLLDPDSGALDNETIVKQVFISLTEKEQLDVFFETFVDVTKEVSARYSGQDFPYPKPSPNPNTSPNPNPNPYPTPYPNPSPNPYPKPYPNPHPNPNPNPKLPLTASASNRFPKH